MDKALIERMGEAAQVAWCHAGRRIPPPYELLDAAVRTFWEAAAVAAAKIAAEECAKVCDEQAAVYQQKLDEMSTMDPNWDRRYTQHEVAEYVAGSIRAKFTP